MGQKINPHGFRLGKLYSWDSKWFAEGSSYQDFLLEDIKLRRFLLEELASAGIVRVEIKRSINTIDVYLHVSRPGVVIGRGGSRLETLKKQVVERLNIKPGDKKAKLNLEVREVKNPNLSARLICQQLIYQLKKRYPYRRAVSKAIQKVMAGGAKGVKIELSGRVGGAEIGRTEKYSQGKIPLQTLRADIDYAESPALTKSGYVGIKVWIYKGEGEID